MEGYHKLQTGRMACTIDGAILISRENAEILCFYPPTCKICQGCEARCKSRNLWPRSGVGMSIDCYPVILSLRVYFRSNPARLMGPPLSPPSKSSSNELFHYPPTTANSLRIAEISPTLYTPLISYAKVECIGNTTYRSCSTAENPKW